MQLTKSKLKQIIQEEFAKALYEYERKDVEIGDIVNFTNFTNPKIYGTEVNDGSTNKFYIITDISKSITSADIECIQVGDVDV